MYRKNFVLKIFYCLAILALAVSTSAAAASPAGHSKVFSVSPNGVDDTVNIQKAFADAKTAGPGSTVRLTAGNFRIRFIVVKDFDGSFTGAGQDKTVIDTFADQDCLPLVEDDQWPTLVQFIRGFPRVSDLGFHITPAAPCKPYPLTYWGSDVIQSSINVLKITSSNWNRRTDCAEIKQEKVSGTVDHITIRGEEGARWNGETDPFFPNIMEGVWMGGTMTINNLFGTGCDYFEKYGQGTFRLTNSTFRMAMYAVNPFGVLNSSFVISDNLFDTDITPIIIGDLSGGVLEIAHNRMLNVPGVGIWIPDGNTGPKPFLQNATLFDFHDNDISLTSVGWGIVAWDSDHLGTDYYPPTDKRINLIVRNNKFHLEPADSMGIILQGVDDALVINNQFTGSGGTVFYAGSWGPSMRGKIMGNDLKNYTLADPSGFMVVLESGTANYFVSGVPADQVADKGTNNVIVNRTGHGRDLLSSAIQKIMSHKGEWMGRMLHGAHYH